MEDVCVVYAIISSPFASLLRGISFRRAEVWTAVCHVRMSSRVSPLASEPASSDHSSRPVSSRHLVIIFQRWLQLLFRSANNHVPSARTIAIDNHVDRSPSPCAFCARFVKLAIASILSRLLASFILLFFSFFFFLCRNCKTLSILRYVRFIVQPNKWDIKIMATRYIRDERDPQTPRSGYHY